MLNAKPASEAKGKTAAWSDSPTWWRNPYCWLVLVGPIVVVFAGLATVWIAMVNADTLVDRNYYQKGLALSKGAGADSIALQPARAARNHAATGGAPVVTPRSGK